jgi:hypothetical protein
MDLSHFFIPATQILQGPYPCQEHPGHRRLVTNCNHLPRPNFAKAMPWAFTERGAIMFTRELRDFLTQQIETHPLGRRRADDTFIGGVLVWLSQSLLKPGQRLIHSHCLTTRIRNAGSNNQVARRQILLLKTANGNFTIGVTKPRQSRFPDRITTATGHTLTRPCHLS